MDISPDSIILLQWEGITVNATIAFTWAVMALLTVGSWIVTRRLSTGVELSRWQNLLESVVMGIQKQIQAISHHDANLYLPFVGTLFLFIAVSNLLAVVPWYEPPTGSLSTTVALALCVFIATPLFGILHIGVRRYLRSYTRPTYLMLPFNIIGEVSRTIALAVRLFGNIMSGTMIAGILLSVVPLFFPIVMQALGLLTGLVQAYIFAILAMVYIASATQARDEKKHSEVEQNEGG